MPVRDLELILPEWPAPANVRAAATTRAGGVSTGPFASLNLGKATEDRPEAVAANRRLLRGRLGLVREPAWLHQVHGNVVVRADAVTDPPAADASWTDQAGVSCVVLVADCLPVLFCDRAGTRVAAAHCGWRGLASDVLGATVRALEVEAGELLAWLGPAIGPDAFEVGPEVRKAFTDRWPETDAAFHASREDRSMCDLYEIARIQLHALGVHNVFGGGHCTLTDSARFYSFRRDGLTGRMAALAWLDGTAVAE
ncbi:MAG TPA: peptidoglycan editing factor PgeF [Gammaproteobacteria bacterium]